MSLTSRFIFLLFSFFISTVPSTYALNQPFDHTAWDQFLKEFVNDKGEVDYQGIQKNPTLLQAYEKKLKSLSGLQGSAETEGFTPWPREEVVALWINAYHVAMIRAVLSRYPVKSINDIPGVWESSFVRVGPEDLYGLNKIRSQKLLGTFRDEKIHLALSCGARGCPRLRREAFTGPRLEGQLFLAAREFVNDPQFNKIVPGEKKLGLSRLFKWYESDFRLDFGSLTEDESPFTSGERAVLSFLVHYLEDAKKIEYLESGDYKIKYLTFDWSLNEWHREKSPNVSGSPASN